MNEEKKQLVPTKMYMRMGGPMSPAKIAEIQKQYEDAGWKVDDKVACLGFVSPCGRWFDGYDTATSRFYRIDGDWKVNLVNSKTDDV